VIPIIIIIKEDFYSYYHKQKKSSSESIVEAFTTLIRLKQNRAKPNDLSGILRGECRATCNPNLPNRG
jgi:hypothetical protein